MTVRVFSIYAVSKARSLANFCEELFKRRETELDSATAVQMESVIAGVGAALFCALVAAVGRRPAHAVCAGNLDDSHGRAFTR